MSHKERTLLYDFLELCKKGSLQQINDAIANGANVNAKNKARMSALMWVIESNSNPGVITALISAGAEVNERTQDGWTPLMWAARKSNPEVITTLIKAGAQINAKSVNGATPLMFAVKFNYNLEVITTLINLGADPKAIDETGKMAIDYAWTNKKFENTEALRALEEVKN